MTLDIDWLDGLWILPMMVLYWLAVAAVVVVGIRLLAALEGQEDDAVQALATSTERSDKTKKAA